MRVTLLTISIILFTLQVAEAQEKKIQWMSFEQAIEKNAVKPKKIFIDMYTDWCGWCKRMDQSTFSDPVIIDYMNKNYYAVKFNAERPDSIVFKGKTYVNERPGEKRSPHNLAAYLLNGKLSYPSFVFMNTDLSVITAVPGYYEASQFEPVLHYFSEEAWKKTKWEEFNKVFKSSYTK